MTHGLGRLLDVLAGLVIGLYGLAVRLIERRSSGTVGRGASWRPSPEPPPGFEQRLGRSHTVSVHHSATIGRLLPFWCTLTRCGRFQHQQSLRPAVTQVTGTGAPRVARVTAPVSAVVQTLHRWVSTDTRARPTQGCEEFPMSRRVTLAPSGLATVYCCDGCETVVVRARDGAPDGWDSSPNVRFIRPGVRRMGHHDLCAPCSVVALLREPRPTSPEVFAFV